jgi:hypothetical protein
LTEKYVLKAKDLQNRENRTLGKLQRICHPLRLLEKDMGGQEFETVNIQKCLFSISFGGTVVLTQDLVLARQVLYSLRHVPAVFALVFFFCGAEA